MPLLLAVVLVVLTACSGPFPQSALAPRSDFSTSLDHLFTNIFWWAVVVFLVVEALLLYAIGRYRARPGAAAPKPVHGHTALEIGWTLAPALILVFIAVPTMRTIFETAGNAPEGALRVEVIGHQWWWEYRYPTLGIGAANELHVPVRTPVQLEMTSADVIHSFWVPRLAGKRDLIQGRINRIEFSADSTGEYWGQCAEFCGASHANMRLRVVVQLDTAFQAWVDRQRAGPAAPATGSPAELGQQVAGPRLVHGVVSLGAATHPCVRRGEHDVEDALVRREPVGERGTGPTDPGQQVVEVGFGQVLAEQLNGTRVRTDAASGHLQKRGLAGPVGAEHHPALVAPDGP